MPGVSIRIMSVCYDVGTVWRKGVVRESHWWRLCLWMPLRGNGRRLLVKACLWRWMETVLIRVRTPFGRRWSWLVVVRGRVRPLGLTESSAVSGRSGAMVLDFWRDNEYTPSGLARTSCLRLGDGVGSLSVWMLRETRERARALAVVLVDPTLGVVSVEVVVAVGRRGR